MQEQGLEPQMTRYRSGDEAARMLPVAFEEWEERARALLAAGPFDYVAGGAGGGDTMRANREAFSRWRIRPRVCCDVSGTDLTVSLLGHKVSAPLLLAPIGVLSILHPDGEVAPAKAAAEAGIPYVLSNVSARTIEEVAEANGEGIRWFQLYPPKDRELTSSFLQRAERAGYSALVVTLDSTMLGWREKDLINGYLPFLTGDGLINYFTDPVFVSKLKNPPEEDRDEAVRVALEEGNNVRFTWKELDFIREHTRLPIWLKGVTHPADAELALEHGVDGIVVSNHGGRQLDGAIATLDALPAVCDVIRDRVPVLMDSGIRRGADVIKALALGATAVMVGRPFAYALAVAGQLGVAEVIGNLIAELKLQLAIAGYTKVKDLDRTLLARVD